MKTRSAILNIFLGVGSCLDPMVTSAAVQPSRPERLTGLLTAIARSARCSSILGTTVSSILRFEEKLLGSAVLPLTLLPRISLRVSGLP